MVRQGIGMRIVAGIIDGVIQFTLAFAITAALIAVMGVGRGAVIIATIVAVAVAGAYSSLEFFKAQTPAKMMFKFIITKQDGSPATKDQLLKRWLFKFSPNVLGLIAVLIAVPAIGYGGNLLSLLVLVSALMCARESKLALHDEWFGTAVYGPGTEPQGFPVGQVPPPPPAA